MTKKKSAPAFNFAGLSDKQKIRAINCMANAEIRAIHCQADISIRNIACAAKVIASDRPCQGGG